MPDSQQPAVPIEFRAATKRYPKSDVTAVDELSLEVQAGEICVLVGPSGCGKTTAMRMVNRLIDITSGDILVGGESVKTRSRVELRRHIGYAIQQVGLFPHRTIAQNIATVPGVLGWEKDRIRARTDELLEMIGLDPDDVRDRFPAQLSGGQRQRVGVARALAADPAVLLMDEPFGAIDPINRERLQNEFLRLQAEIRKTIIFVTHDIDEAIKMGDRVAVMKQGGRVAQYASPADLLMNPADEFVEQFVGSDRALKRLALQRVRDVDLWKAALVREGDPVHEVRARIADSDIDIPLLVDEAGRPVGWLAERGLAGQHVERQLRSPAEPVIELDDVLRDGLGRLLANESVYGPVIDSQGRVVGLLSLELIAAALQVPGTEVRSSSELLAE